MASKAHVPRKQQVFSITSAATSHSDDLGSREKRYAISMGVRTVCFVGGVILVFQSMPWKALGWACFVGAVFLPYVAVVLANSGVRRKGQGPSPFGKDGGHQLEETHRSLPRDHRDD